MPVGSQTKVSNNVIFYINLLAPGHARVHILHCGYLFLGAKVPGHQYPLYEYSMYSTSLIHT